MVEGEAKWAQAGQGRSEDITRALIWDLGFQVSISAKSGPSL